MKKLAILAPTVALIFACSSNTSLQPGQWEMTTKITDIQVPGAPPAAAAQMKQMMASQGTQTQSRCITPAEAANPAGSFGNPGGGAQGCNFTKQTFAGGSIDIAGTCQSPSGNVEMTSTGSYTGDTMTMNFTANAQAMGQTVRTSGTMTGRRTGDCPG